MPSAKISSAGEESPGSKLFEMWNSKEEFDESRRDSSLRIRAGGSITGGGGGGGGALSDWPRSLEKEIRW